LAGFFYNTQSEERFPRSALHFVNISGSEGEDPFIYPSFAFLPDRRRLHLLDCCNGLILCQWYDVSTTRDDEFRYVVCNPATEEWVALPDRGQAGDGNVGTACLGFDPAVSPHFHVFVFLLDESGFISGVDVYSSETRQWIHKEKRWDVDVMLAHPQLATVFLDGYLYLPTICGDEGPRISAVDTKGETWSNFDTPCGQWRCDVFLGLIQQSQGRLHYACFNNGEDDEEETQLQVYSLEDHAKKEWILKHRLKFSTEVFGSGPFEGEFDWIAMHPEGNLMFFVEGSDNMLTCYSMDDQESTELRELREAQPPYLPYVPLYSELESLRM
jgi:F-box interacting protein